MKRDIVQADEFDKGKRKLLNLGHTIGHAVEKLSGFEISHGDAVAIGMAAVVRKCADAERVIALLKKYGLPTSCPYGAEEIISACMADKKIEHGKLQLIVPERIGLCNIVPTEIEELKSWLEND